ncbi:MAG: hypothetical protein ABIA78_04080 [archaeon]
MNNTEKRVVEILLGTILIILIITLIFLVTQFTSTGFSTSEKSISTTVTNSYNTNYYPKPQQQIIPVTAKYPTSYYTKNPTYKTISYPTTTKNIYLKEKNYYPISKNYIYITDKPNYKTYQIIDKTSETQTQRTLKFTTIAQYEKQKGVFGNDVDNYVVYVKNNDVKGGYFTTTFYFQDYNDREFRQALTHYIGAHEEKKFIYRDIYSDKYKHYNWDYKVVSNSKVPLKNNYVPTNSYYLYDDKYTLLYRKV